MEDTKERTLETPTEPALEQQLQAIKTEKGRLETELAEKTKGLKTAHDNLRLKDVEIKKRADTDERLASLENLVKLSTAYMMENQGKTAEDFEEAKTKRPEDLQKKFDNILAEGERKRKLESQRQEIVSKLTDLQTRVEGLGLSEDDDAYLEIKTLAVMATPDSIKLAERKLKKLEDIKEANKEVKKVETPTETEDERIEKKARELLEKRGLLKPEGNKPSGGEVLSSDKILSTLDPSKMTPKQIHDRVVEIAQAAKEGRIK